MSPEQRRETASKQVEAVRKLIRAAVREWRLRRAQRALEGEHGD